MGYDEKRESAFLFQGHQFHHEDACVNAFVGGVAEVGEIVDDDDFTVEFMGRGFDVVDDMLLISFGSYCIGIYFRSVQAIRKDVSFSGLLLAVTELKLLV